MNARDRRERCARCWGTGRLATHGQFGMECPDCDGTGWVYQIKVQR